MMFRRLALLIVGVGAARHRVRVVEGPDHRSSVMLFYDASGALADTWTGQLSQEAPVGRLETVLRD